MATIQEFKAALAGGGARANQYHVILPSWGGSQSQEQGKFLCKAASLPASNIADIEVMYRGRQVHFAGERTFEPWVVTILNDSDFTIRTEMENWMNAISMTTETRGIVQPGMYQRNMSVFQLDRNDREVYEYLFMDAYPTIISDITLGYDQGTAIEEFTVTFTYNNWISVNLGGGFVNKALNTIGAASNAIGAAKALGKVLTA